MTTITERASINDNFIFDCDGVLWQADEQIGDAFKAIEWLEEQGKKVFYVTNNATKMPFDVGQKME